MRRGVRGVGGGTWAGTTEEKKPEYDFLTQKKGFSLISTELKHTDTLETDTHKPINDQTVSTK